MPLFQGFRPVVGTICPSSAAAVVGPPRASQGMKKGRRPRRRPRLKLSDRAGPDQCPVPGENALFTAQIAGFLAVSRPVPVYPVFLNYVVPVHLPEVQKTTSALCKSGMRRRIIRQRGETAVHAVHGVFRQFARWCAACSMASSWIKLPDSSAGIHKTGGTLRFLPLFCLISAVLP